MSKDTIFPLGDVELSSLSLDELAQLGAQTMLRHALEAEIRTFLDDHGHLQTATGKPGLVRNGYHKERKIAVGTDMISVSVPRTRNRLGGDEQFISSIVPKYLRRSLKVDEAIPLFYLKGISTGNMEEAFQKLLGDDVSGLSASNISRLKACWEDEYEEWLSRSLVDNKYCYIFADGIHISVRSEDKKLCLLVIIGINQDGRKELLAVNSGGRESKSDWEEVLRGLQAQGLQAPALAVGDGALGFWNAMREVFPDTESQRCWVHKKRNILDKMPDSTHDEAKRMINNIFNAEKKESAREAVKAFEKRFEHTQYKAVKCLLESQEELLTFYDFPKEHWRHIRSTNIIESVFSTVRLRTNTTRGMGTRKTAFTMTFKLLQMFQKRWQRVFGYTVIPFVLSGAKYENGDPIKVA